MPWDLGKKSEPESWWFSDLHRVTYTLFMFDLNFKSRNPLRGSHSLFLFSYNRGLSVWATMRNKVHTLGIDHATPLASSGVCHPIQRLHVNASIWWRPAMCHIIRDKGWYTALKRRHVREYIDQFVNSKQESRESMHQQEVSWCSSVPTWSRLRWLPRTWDRAHIKDRVDALLSYIQGTLEWANYL
jgi:hypothetical protein